MRLLAIGAALIALSATASAQVYVHGYTKKDGTYVAPHYRSNPDGNPYNNWSTRGNVNPYTGQAGTRNPYSRSYGSYRNGNGLYGSSNNVGNLNSTYPKSNSSYGYSNPYSSTGNGNSSSAATCYFPPC